MVPENQVARLTKVVPKLEEVKLKLTQVLVTATSSDMEKWVPVGITTKGKDLNAKLTEILKAMSEILDTKLAPKGKVTELIKSAQDASQATKELCSSIDLLVKMND